MFIEGGQDFEFATYVEFVPLYVEPERLIKDVKLELRMSWKKERLLLLMNYSETNLHIMMTTYQSLKEKSMSYTQNMISRRNYSKDKILDKYWKTR